MGRFGKYTGNLVDIKTKDGDRHTLLVDHETPRHLVGTYLPFSIPDFKNVAFPKWEIGDISIVKIQIELDMINSFRGLYKDKYQSRIDELITILETARQKQIAGENQTTKPTSTPKTPFKLTTFLKRKEPPIKTTLAPTHTL